MAVLNKIRQRSVFLIIIIALALFSFVLADVIRNGGLGSDKAETNVAVINGKDIPRIDFAEKVEAYQKQVGPNISSTQAVNTIWEQEVRSTLLAEQYEAIGLTVSEDQLMDNFSTSLANNPTFQDESGFFSEAKLKEYVASIKGNPTLYGQWMDYVEATTRSILETTYLNMVKGGLVSTLAEGERNYRYENDKVDLEFVYVPYTSIPDGEIAVTDEDINKYVKEHAKEFEVDAQVDIQYVAFSEAPSPSDIEEARNEILALKNESVISGDSIEGMSSTNNIKAFIEEHSDREYTPNWMYAKDVPAAIKDTIFKMSVGDIYGPYKVDNTYNMSKLIGKRQLPDSVKARHILIPIGFNANDSITRTDAQAKKTADSILKIVKTNKSKFVDIVKSTSSDEFSIKNDGVYDWYSYDSMVEEFRDFTFEGKVGAVEVVKTRFGYHVISIEDQKNLKPVVKVATLVKNIEASEKTLNDVFSQAANFEVASKEGDMDAAARQNNLTLKPVNKIGVLDATIPGIGENRSIVTWAFKEDTEVGDISKFKVNDGYVIVQLTRKSEEGLMSATEASASVTPIIRKQKKAKQIMESISGSNLQEIASNKGVQVQSATAVTMATPTIPGAGNEPKVVGTAFGLEAGQDSKLIEGNNGVFKIKVIRFNKAPDLDNYAAFANQLNNALIPQINNKVNTALKNAAEIEDNRGEFY